MIKAMPYIRTAPVGGSPLLLSQTTGLLAKAAGPTTKVLPSAGGAVVLGPGAPGVPGVLGGVIDFVRQNPLVVLGGVALLAVLMRKKKK